MYCQIIFAQGDETMVEAESLLYAGGFPTVENLREAVDFLSQWDYGTDNEYDDALAESIEHNRFEDCYHDDESGYTIVSKRGLYISLWRKAVSGYELGNGRPRPNMLFDCWFEGDVLHISHDAGELEMFFGRAGLVAIASEHSRIPITQPMGMGYERDEWVAEAIRKNEVAVETVDGFPVAVFSKQVMAGPMLVVAAAPDGSWNVVATGVDYGSELSLYVYGTDDEIADIYDFSDGHLAIRR